MRSKDISPLTHGSPSEKAAASRLRLLDFDDLFVLSQLLEGQTIAATAKQLGLTQPAITQRVRKIERVFAEPLLTKVGRHVRLTPEGLVICQRAAEALTMMLSLDAAPAARGLTVAASADVLRVWLGPALRALRVVSPEHILHAELAREEDWPADVQAGRIDAAVTLTSARPNGCEERLLMDVEYVMVAGVRTAPTMARFEDLASVTLIERDRALPLWSQIQKPELRSKLKLNEAWFLASDAQILNAVMDELGVAVLPAVIAAPALAAGRLRVILPEVELALRQLRLIYRFELANDPRLAGLSRTIAASAGP